MRKCCISKIQIGFAVSPCFGRLLCILLCCYDPNNMLHAPETIWTTTQGLYVEVCRLCGGRQAAFLPVCSQFVCSSCEGRSFANSVDWRGSTLALSKVLLSRLRLSANDPKTIFILTIIPFCPELVPQPRCLQYRMLERSSVNLGLRVEFMES